MKRKRIWMIIAVLCLLAVCACGALYGGIQWDAHQKAEAVWAAYPQAGNEVEALMLQMQSESESMQTRNMAVWALGRLRAKAALPVMRSYYTGQKCDHTTCLCQSELEKAIKRCGGDI